MSETLYMSDERYLAALKRIRKSIAEGGPLLHCNSNVTGDKNTECSWGLCSEDPQHWPDAEDHMWPDLFTKNGRVAPLYWKTHQYCPMDCRMQDEKMDLNGCYFSCRIFKRRKHPEVTREKALELYDAAILRAGKNFPDFPRESVMNDCDEGKSVESEDSEAGA